MSETLPPMASTGVVVHFRFPFERSISRHARILWRSTLGEQLYATVCQGGETSVVHSQLTHSGDRWVVMEGKVAGGRVLLDYIATGEREQWVTIRAPDRCAADGGGSCSEAHLSAQAAWQEQTACLYGPSASTTPHASVDGRNQLSLEDALRLSAMVARLARVAKAAAQHAAMYLHDSEVATAMQPDSIRGSEQRGASCKGPQVGGLPLSITGDPSECGNASTSSVSSVRLQFILPDGTRAPFRTRADVPLEECIISLARHALFQSAVGYRYANGDDAGDGWSALGRLTSLFDSTSGTTHTASCVAPPPFKFCFHLAGDSNASSLEQAVGGSVPSVVKTRTGETSGQSEQVRCLRELAPSASIRITEEGSAWLAE